MALTKPPHLVVILAGYALGAALYSRLPETEFGPGRPMAAFLLPTAAAITDVLLRNLARRSFDADAAPAALVAYDAVMLRIVAFLVAVHATILLLLTGTLAGRAWTGRIVPVLLGVTMIRIGNLLPRIRPNVAIGIRTARTLADHALWVHAHRSAGYWLVGFGVVIVVAAITLPRPAGPGMIQLVAPAAALGVPVLLRRLQRAVP